MDVNNGDEKPVGKTEEVAKENGNAITESSSSTEPGGVQDLDKEKVDIDDCKQAEEPEEASGEGDQQSEESRSESEDSIDLATGSSGSVGGPGSFKGFKFVKRLLVWYILVWYFLWSEPAKDFGVFLITSTGDLIRSTCCILYEMLFGYTCLLGNVSNIPLNSSMRPEFEDLFRSRLEICPVACGKEVPKWCDMDQQLLFPNLYFAVFLAAKIVLHGVLAIFGRIWSAFGFVVDVIYSSILLACMLMISLITISAIMGYIYPIMKSFLKGLATNAYSSQRKKGASTHPNSKRKRSAADTASKNADPLSYASFSMTSLLSSLEDMLDILDDGCGSSNCLGDVNAKNLPLNKTYKLEDYKGATNAKKELQRVIEFLKTPKKFHEFGARLPRGVLLYGPPGTGKTLFARTLAGEANVGFIHKCASEFRTMFVGSGAKNIRSLFNAARRNAPCIVFIDEIDSISKRTSSDMHPYANQAINQLLYEMDGFLQNDSDVVVVGATNRLDNIDPALLRPGRFDTIVRVDLPDVDARKEILEHYMKQLKKLGDLDVKSIAAKTDEYSGAELEYLVNEAAIIAASTGAEKVEQKHLEEALGKRKKSLEEMKEFDSVNYKPSSKQAIAHMYN